MTDFKHCIKAESCRSKTIYSRTHRSDVQSVNASDGVCRHVKIGLHKLELMSINTGVRINEICYCDVLRHKSCCLPHVSSQLL